MRSFPDSMLLMGCVPGSLLRGGHTGTKARNEALHPSLHLQAPSETISLNLKDCLSLLAVLGAVLIEVCSPGFCLPESISSFKKNSTARYNMHVIKGT